MNWIYNLFFCFYACVEAGVWWHNNCDYAGDRENKGEYAGEMIWTDEHTSRDRMLHKIK